ncbi:MAG TPA: M55 family metallopeptidase [Anaerolineaceae bacterium]|nr:M55 family metallopeptidase [Anaerolineaceae bacterium]HPN51302.1 M55 family metallopeptidase [Anaerolineaceae bacterium]
MKLLIACDMEGISGVANWDHVTPGHAEYERFRRIMTADVNAAIAGAAEAGATEIVITDGHWNSSNILIEQLDQRARLNCSSPSPLSMVQGVDEGVDAAFFVGYHARAGTPQAILDHTWSSARVANLWLNGRLTGETGLNAAMCGFYNVPVLMVTGDQAVCAEARDFLGDKIETVQVKKTCARYASEVLSPAVTQPAIQAGARKAAAAFLAGKGPAVFKLPEPVEVIVEFFFTDMADRAVLMPGSERLDGRRVRFEARNMREAYQAFRTLVTLANR